MDDIFNAQDDTPTPEQLLERYGNDPAKLALGKIEADKTIAARERELAEAREAISQLTAKETVYENLMQSLGRNVDPQAPREPEPQPAPASPAPMLSEEDLAARIREIQNETRTQERINANVSEVTAKMVETFGDTHKANEHIRAKASELGVGLEFLQGTAAQNPKAFYKLIGLDEANPATPRPSHSDVNAEALRTPGPRAGSPGTYSYYRELRRNNPNEYFSTKVQNQIHKDAAAFPGGVSAFYKT